MKRLLKLSLSLSLICTAATATAQTQRREVYVGYPRVVDGDTIRIGSDLLRIYGIDAPELSQQCVRDGSPYRCGTEASVALGLLIGPARVECRYRDWNEARQAGQQTRVIVQCTTLDVDIGDWMVSRGHAVPFYSRIYNRTGRYACETGIGLWSGQFVRPSEYRRGRTGPAARLGKESGRDCRAAQVR